MSAAKKIPAPGLVGDEGVTIDDRLRRIEYRAGLIEANPAKAAYHGSRIRGEVKVIRRQLGGVTC